MTSPTKPAHSRGPFSPGVAVRGLLQRADALVLFNVLTQSPKATLFFSDRHLQFFIETADAFQVFGAEQFEQERRCLREIAENVFYLVMKPVILCTLSHN